VVFIAFLSGTYKNTRGFFWVEFFYNNPVWKTANVNSMKLGGGEDFLYDANLEGITVEAMRNRALRLCSGAWDSINWPNSTDLWCFIFQFGGLEHCLSGIKPPKSSRGDGLGPWTMKCIYPHKNVYIWKTNLQKTLCWHPTSDFLL